MSKVCIGLPVYNGENYVGTALDSLLSQTFDDFTLIISDNASTDGTEEICRDYARRDPRIEYVRQPENLGAAPNFNLLVGRSRSPYFKWAAHDDVLDPAYLAGCVRVLEEDPSIVLCTTRSRIIDAEGTVTGTVDAVEDMDHPKLTRRFAQVLNHDRHLVHPVFGVIRRSALEGTDLIGAYGSSDRILLTHLAMKGRLAVLPEYHFLSRSHAGQSVRSHRSLREYARWFDPAARSSRYPHWKLLREYYRLLSIEPLSLRQRLVCHVFLLREIVRMRRRLIGNLVQALFARDRRTTARDAPAAAGGAGTATGDPGRDGA